MTKNDRANFGSKLGVILASAGSAVGLGNIWRFPYETGNHGGAAFILIYLGCVFLLGLPILIAEFLIGRRSRANTAGAYQKLAPGTHWRWVGRMGVLAAFLILSYYSVVAGWTLEYVYEALTNGFTGKTPTEFISSFQQFSSSPWRPVLWLVLFLLVTHFIIVKGVEKGIEKSSKIMMPTLFIIILILVICSVTLPGAGAGIEFLLNVGQHRVHILHTGVERHFVLHHPGRADLLCRTKGHKCTAQRRQQRPQLIHRQYRAQYQKDQCHCIKWQNAGLSGADDFAHVSSPCPGHCPLCHP